MDYYPRSGGVLDFAKIAKLRATAGDFTQACAAERHIERVLVASSTIDGSDMLVEARDNRAGFRHLPFRMRTR